MWRGLGLLAIRAGDINAAVAAFDRSTGGQGCISGRWERTHRVLELLEQHDVDRLARLDFLQIAVRRDLIDSQPEIDDMDIAAEYKSYAAEKFDTLGADASAILDEVDTPELRLTTAEHVDTPEFRLTLTTAEHMVKKREVRSRLAALGIQVPTGG